MANTSAGTWPSGEPALLGYNTIPTILYFIFIMYDAHVIMGYTVHYLIILECVYYYYYYRYYPVFYSYDSYTGIIIQTVQTY